jgi:hypothetical protein
MLSARRGAGGIVRDSGRVHSQQEETSGTCGACTGINVVRDCVGS